MLSIYKKLTQKDVNQRNQQNINAEIAIQIAETTPLLDNNKIVKHYFDITQAKDVLINIFYLLSPKDIFMLAQTCKLFLKISKDERVWKNIGKQLGFQNPSKKIIHSPRNTDYFSLKKQVDIIYENISLEVEKKPCNDRSYNGLVLFVGFLSFALGVFGVAYSPTNTGALSVSIPCLLLGAALLSCSLSTCYKYKQIDQQIRFFETRINRFNERIALIESAFNEESRDKEFKNTM